MKKKIALLLGITALFMLIMLSAHGENEKLPQLEMPTDLQWGPYYVKGEYKFDYNGMICWKENTEQPDHGTMVYVYNEDGEEVYQSGWKVRQGDHPWQNDHDFVNNMVMKLPSGKYYFVLQAEGDGETCRSSEKAVSPVWEYTRPEVQQESPTGPKWNEFPNNQWDAATEEHVAGYTVVYYYSKDDPHATATKDLKRLGGNVWYFATGKKTMEEAFHALPKARMKEDGYSASCKAIVSTYGCNLQLHFSFQLTVSCQMQKNPLC